MFECYQEIVRILVKVQKRKQLISQFQEEVDEATHMRAKGYYFIILKISTRIFNQIERLRIDFPILNRPFIYNRENFQNALVRDGMNIRNNLIKRFKELKSELNRILDKSGKIVQMEVQEQSEAGMESQSRRDQFVKRGSQVSIKRGSQVSVIDLIDQRLKSSASMKSYHLLSQENFSERGNNSRLS